jgi:hypothetical protein
MFFINIQMKTVRFGKEQIIQLTIRDHAGLLVTAVPDMFLVLIQMFHGRVLDFLFCYREPVNGRFG